MKEKKLNPGDQVIITKSGYYHDDEYKVGEIWTFTEYYSENVIICSRGKICDVKLMINNGSTQRKECKPYVPEVINQYEIY